MEKIINNSISFVIAYIFVFAVVQISTILQAFSYDVPVIVYSSYLDFSTLTSAVSDEVWQSADNVINIFGSGIILLVLLFFLSIVLLVRWKSKKIWIQRILFWIIICSFTGWISLQSKRLSRVFSNTRVQKHQFLGAQPP